jgi:thioredoxin
MAIIQCETCAALNRAADDPATPPPLGDDPPPTLDSSAGPLPIHDAELLQAIATSTVPVLVDFSAKWCGACHSLTPHVDKLAHAQAGKLLVLTLDVDADPATPTRYNVDALPTLVLFKVGKEVERKVGGLSQSELDGWVESLIGG